LYLQEAACHQAADREREAKALEKLSKEEYLKMMLEDSGPGEDGRRKVRWYTYTLTKFKISLCKALNQPRRS
jgi:hypothetical protein